MAEEAYEITLHEQARALRRRITLRMGAIDPTQPQALQGKRTVNVPDQAQLFCVA